MVLLRSQKQGDIMIDITDQSKILIERLPFATIELGKYHTTQQLIAFLDGTPDICEDVEELLNHISFVDQPNEIKLYEASNDELGYPTGCTVAQSFAALEKIGAQKLPQEAGPLYRRDYPNQKIFFKCMMYMDSITDADGRLRAFRIEQACDGCWLDDYDASLGKFYPEDCVWTFTR